MRRTMIAAFGLALSLGAASLASAQATQPPERPDRSGEMRRGDRRGGPDAMLLKGITLTADQKTRIEALHKSAESSASREQFRKAMTDARASRERGDTATANSRMRELRSQMQAQRERQVASLRSVLTSEQRRQFDANVKEWKQRAAEHEKDRGEHAGGWQGRGGRSGQRPGGV